jgi:hypothetical protein
MTTMEYKVVAGNTSASDPGNGSMRFNTSAQSDATQLYFDQLGVGNIDYASVLSALVAGDTLDCQQKDNAAAVVNYAVNGVTDNAGWFTVDVTPGASSGLPIPGNKGLLVTVNAMASTKTVTINAGESMSNSVDLSGLAVAMVLAPPEWSPANLSFQVSPDNNVFYDLFDVAGNEIIKPIRVGSAIVIDQSVTRAVNYLRVRSGVRDNPVVQQADRVITLVVV